MKRTGFDQTLPFVLLGTCLFGMAACSAPEVKKPDRELSAVVDTRSVEERLATGMERRISLGLAFGLVGAVRDGEKSSIVIRGKKSLEPPAPLSETDGLEIGSVSKTFTGILVHLAIGEGKLKESTTLSEVLPSLRGKDAGEITIHSLGLHCSGLPRLVPGVPVSDAQDPLKDATEKMLLTALEGWKKPAVVPSCAPDQQVYSNWGYTTLGLVLEKVYRASFADLVRTRIARSLKIPEVGIDRGKRRRGKFVPNLVSAYDAAGDLSKAWTFPAAYAATGGIEMTARELRGFIDALVSPPPTALGRAIEASFASGIGWDSPPGTRVHLKNGMTGGFSSLLYVDPSKKQGLFIVSNQAITIDGLGYFAGGILAKDDLVEAIEKGRVHASDAEVTRLKGRFAFLRTLDEAKDEVDATKLPKGELEAVSTPVDITESAGRLVAHVGSPPDRIGVFLYPDAAEGQWHIVDGLFDTERFEITEASRLLLPTTGQSGKKYFYEYRKLETRPESYPAFEQ